MVLTLLHEPIRSGVWGEREWKIVEVLLGLVGWKMMGLMLDEPLGQGRGGSFPLYI